jgi:hypothetical protein
MADKNTIVFSYIIHPGREEKLNSIEFNGEMDFSQVTCGPEDKLLSKLDRALLETRPSLAKLSIGTFKLKSDIAMCFENNEERIMRFGAHNITYERVEEDYKEKK